jgi:hypothetical protein
MSSLELNRDALLRGIMQGFARAYDMLVPDDMPNKRTGYQAAVETYLPIHYKFLQELAVQVGGVGLTPRICCRSMIIT